MGKRESIMTLPQVSVVVATYRRTEELKKALDSLTEQTYLNYEIIVVDDNGEQKWNQKVKEIIEGFQSSHPEIRLKHIVNPKNVGSANARNIGIENCEGEYVSFLDDDDIYLPNRLETQLKGMLEQNADYSFTDLYLYNEKEKLIDRRVRNYIKNYDKKSLLEYHLKYHMTGTDTVMFKKEYLFSIGCFDPINVGDEFYLMHKAILGEGKLYYQPECHVKAYVHTGEGGMSSGKGKIDGENQLYIFKKQFFGQISGKSRRYIRMRHYAVLAFAGLRMKNFIYAMCNGILSFLCTPMAFIGMCVERKR